MTGVLWWECIGCGHVYSLPLKSEPDDECPDCGFHDHAAGPLSDLEMLDVMEGC